MIILNNDKYNQNTNRRKANNITCSLHPTYEETTLSNMQSKHHVR